MNIGEWIENAKTYELLMAIAVIQDRLNELGEEE